jgi:hypothetical protein
MNIAEARAQNLERRIDELERRIAVLEGYVLPKQEGLRGDTTDGPLWPPPPGY